MTPSTARRSELLIALNGRSRRSTVNLNRGPCGQPRNPPRSRPLYAEKSIAAAKSACQGLSLLHGIVAGVGPRRRAAGMDMCTGRVVASKRVRAALIIVPLLIVVGVGVLGVAALHAQPGSKMPAQRQARHVFVGEVLDRPVTLPSQPLVDTSGRRYVMAQRLKGRVALVYGGYTHCPDACPTTMANLAEVLRESPASVRSAVSVVFISEDPARDTPAVIRGWLDHFSSAFVGLTGGEAASAHVVHALGLPRPFREAAGPAGGYDVSHVPAVLAFGRDGVARIAYSPDASIAGMVGDLTALVRGIQPPAPSPPDLQVTGANLDFGRMQLLTGYVTAPSDRSATVALHMTLVDVAPQPDTLTAVTTDVGQVRWRRRGEAGLSRRLSLAPHQPVTIGTPSLQLLVPHPTRLLRPGQTVRVRLRFATAGWQTAALPVVPAGGLGASP